MNLEIVLLILIIIVILGLCVVLYFAVKNQNGSEQNKEIEKMLTQLESRLNIIESSNSELRRELSSTVQISVKNMGELLATNQKAGSENIENRLKTFSSENEQKLENIRMTMERRLSEIKTENTTSLEEMRKTVDEKLQSTLEEKFSRSFNLVSERLEQVYKGLGEMKNLANGVGDLKKVLSNVKTRGIIGEYQLSAILKEVLSPEQYDENVATKKRSKNFVEFAVKLPADDNEFVYLPIDSKFPGDTYTALSDAYDSGDKARIDEARKILERTLVSEARDISQKYIDPPNTTDFAIMFLPFEGLYAEAVNLGIVERLQRNFKVNIAGPSTMAALLNSLQMGFKTLAVQKQSAEVWKVLSDVKKEFETFGNVLEKTQKRINQANEELDKLVSVRTRQIQSKLSNLSKVEPKQLSDNINND